MIRIVNIKFSFYDAVRSCSNTLISRLFNTHNLNYSEKPASSYKSNIFSSSKSKAHKLINKLLNGLR